MELAGCPTCADNFISFKSYIRGRQALAADAAGNTYVTGVTTAGATEDVLTVKYNSQGVVQWSATYDGGDIDRGFAVAVDASGNVYVAGQSWAESFFGSPMGYVLVVKYNASGVQQWATRWESGVLSAGFVLAVDGSGNAYVAGEYYSSTDDLHKMMTLKLDAAGALQWYRFAFYGYDYEEGSAYDLALDGSGNAYVTGFLYKPQDGPDTDGYVTVKYSPTGATLWTREHDSVVGDVAYDVAVDSSGNVHVAGTSGVVRYNSAGTQQWVGAFNGVAHALINVNGMVFATGVSGSDIVTARYDATGTRLWSTSYNLGGTEEAFALRLVGNNLYVAGRSNTDALLVGFNKDSGASTLADLYDSGADDRAYSMAFTGTSDFWVAGRAGDNYLTIKYTVPSGPTLSALTLAPATFAGGCQTSSGKVTLTAPAPAGGAVVTITDTNPAASMPASVTVPAGATTAKFTITAVAVAAKQAGTVTASYAGVSKSATVTVRPIGVASLTLSPNPVVGPNSVVGTVTLECPAAPSSITVALTSSNAPVASTVPSLSIPAGSTTGTFTITTADVSVVSSANIKATANGIARTVTLTVNP
ncbi:MAG TPA: hypothetical protein VNM67_23880 [Thermoanaerobaculia bacterium]|nr:hypothetical protein [Thermoanaerobaculia bacterium]